MDAFEILKADHQKVAELFDRLDTATGQTKLTIFKQIKSELELHTHIEEKIFYPAVEKPEETHDLTLEAYVEHNVVKALLEELGSAKSADDEWQAKAKVLRENVEHHVDEEENELFDKADDALSNEEIERLGQEMEAEKARAQGRPAPQPSSARKASKKKGIIAQVAEFVGLRPASTEKVASPRKTTAKKTGAKKTTAKKKLAAKPAKKKAAKKAIKRSKSTRAKRTSKSSTKGR